MGKATLVGFILLLLLFASLACDWRPGVPGAATSSRNEDVAVRVKLERAPALFEPVKVTVTIQARRQVNGPVDAWLRLPPTAAFINGQTRWQGEMAEGDSDEFEATIAFVVEGTSTIFSDARYATSPPKIPGTETVGDGEWLLVTKERGVLRPPDSAAPPTPAVISNIQSYNASRTPYDGSALLNESGIPRVVVHNRSGLEELRQQGLVPADPWGRWQGDTQQPLLSVLDGDWDETAMMVFLYDQQRPTTGYHFAALRPLSENQLYSTEPIRPLREGEARPSGPVKVYLNILSSPPKPDWPVEKREVSPYQVQHVTYSYSYDGRPLDLVVQINGKDISHHIVDPAITSPSFAELNLESAGETPLP